MNETYVECMIKRKISIAMKILKYVIIMMAVFCILVGMLFGSLVFFLFGLILVVIAYFASLNSEIEYEYLYVDRQLSVDKILNKTKRKKIANYEVDRIEILAPLKSHHLDSFKKREVRVVDYTSGIMKNPDPRYAIYYEGNAKIIFEPSIEMVNAISIIAPRKVFKE